MNTLNSMMKKFSVVVLAGVLVGMNASAITVDFNSVFGIIGPTYSSGGITFTALGGILQCTGGPNGTDGLLAYDLPTDTLHFIRADIAGGATTVSVDLGDYGGDPDQLFLQVFDSANNSLGYKTLLSPADFSGMTTLSLTSANISYAIFGSLPPSGGGSSVYADNFTTSLDLSVPDDANTLTLLAAGLSTLGLVARRIKTKMS